MKKTYKANLRKYLLFALIIYSIIVFWLLFFQVGSTVRATYFDSRKVHLIPFESSFNSIKLALTNNFSAPHKTHYRYITFRNFVGNLLLFCPWGFLAPQLFSYPGKFYKIVLSTAVFSITAEIIQYSYVVGVADIDDVLLNVVGAIAGYYSYVYFLKRN